MTNTIKNNKYIIIFLSLISPLLFYSCKKTPPQIRELSADETYDIIRNVEKETGIYSGACTNDEHETGVEYCSRYVGPKTEYGECEICGCSRYDHWGTIGLEDDETEGNTIENNDDINDSDKDYTPTNSVTRLEVSDEYLDFDEDGESKSVYVYTDGTWNIDVQPESWVNVSVHNNRIDLRLSRNNTDEARSDYFTLAAGDYSVKIRIYQGRSNTCSTCNGKGTCNGDGSNPWEWDQWEGNMVMRHVWTKMVCEMVYNMYYNSYVPNYNNVTVKCATCGGDGKCQDCGGSGKKY